MTRFAVSCVFLASLLMIFDSPSEAFKCTVCHSKNPAMVRMHQAIRDRDIGCFDCHRVGEKLMGKGRSHDRKALLLRRSGEQPCVGCHEANGGGEPAPQLPAGAKRSVGAATERPLSAAQASR